MIQPPRVPSQERAVRFVPFEETAAHRSISNDALDPLDRIAGKRHVGMSKQQYLSRGGVGASVYLMGPATRRPEERHAGIRPSHPIGPIPRAAVDHQQLVRHETGQMREGTLNEIALVENRQDDRDFRHCQNSQAAAIATDPYSARRTQPNPSGLPRYMK